MKNNGRLTRRSTIKLLGGATLSVPGLGVLGSCASSSTTVDNRPGSKLPRNVVMIAIDDLNDYVGFLGGYTGDAQTPNLDSLARSGRRYTNAHACVPVCMPSRAAVMFGKRPDTTKIYDHSGGYAANPPISTGFGRYNALLDDPGMLSLPQMVKLYGNQNYKTMSMGKVFHSARPEQWDFQGPYSEIGEIYSAYPPDSADFFNYGLLPADDVHQDQKTADWACSVVSEGHAQPVFLAIGLYQPHVPWHLPQWAFDLHPLDSVVVPEYRPDDLDDVPPAGKVMARQPWSEATGSNFDLVLREKSQARVVQAYLAATSHTDRMLGQIVSAIDAGPNASNTDIILWSDHGYHLGEKLHVRKGTLWEKSTRVPLIIRSSQTSPGELVTAAVSLIDIAPTVIEMTGGDPAQVADAEALDGVSLFSETSSEAITYWQGGVALRTKKWRYILYADGTQELYDHDNDPNEYDNLAGDSRFNNKLESFAAIVSGYIS